MADELNTSQMPHDTTTVGDQSTNDPSNQVVDGVWKTPPEITAREPTHTPSTSTFSQQTTTSPMTQPIVPASSTFSPIAAHPGKKSIVAKIMMWLVIALVLVFVVIAGLVYADDTGLLTTNIAVPLQFMHLSSLSGGLSPDPKQAGTQVTSALQSKHSFALVGQLHGYSDGSATLSCSATGTTVATDTSCSSSTAIDPLSLDTSFNLVAIGQNFILKNTLSDAGVNIQTEYRSVDGLLYSLSTFGGSASATTTPQTDGQWIKAGQAPTISPDTVRDRIGTVIAGSGFKGAETVNSVASYHYSSSVAGNDVPVLSVFAGTASVDQWLKSNGSIDVWVGRKDHLPTRILINLTNVSSKKLQLDATFATTTLGEVAAPEGAIDPTALLSPDQIRKSDLSTLASALAKYHAEKGTYPISTSVDHLDKADSVLAKALVPVYVTTIPKDSNPARYYGYVSDGVSFELSAVLDDATDPDVHTTGSVHLYTVKNPAVAP